MLHPNSLNATHKPTYHHVHTRRPQRRTLMFVPPGCVVACFAIFGKRLWSQLKSINSSRWPGGVHKVSKLRSVAHAYTYTLNHNLIPFLHIPPLQRRSVYKCLSQRLAPAITLKQILAKDERKKWGKSLKISQEASAPPAFVPWAPFFFFFFWTFLFLGVQEWGGGIRLTGSALERL